MMMRWLAACGIMAPVADILITAGLGALDPGYSHGGQYISELGEDGRPYAAAFNAWSVAYGLLFAGFAIGLSRDLGSRAVLAVLLAVAASSAAAGIFPCDPGCAGITPAAKIHFLAGYVAVPAIVLAPFLSGAAMSGRPAWRGYRAFSLAAGILLVVASGWLVAGYFAGRGQWWCPVGVAQRVTLGIQYGWLVVLGGRLWVLAGRDSSAVVGTDGPGAEPVAAPDRGGM